MGKILKTLFSEIMRPTAHIFCFQQCLVVSYINPAIKPLGSRLAMPRELLAPTDLQWEKP